MNLTLTDLLTPVQIEQAHQTLVGIMLAIDAEQDQELTRVHKLFNEKRREARREAILKALQGDVVLSAPAPDPEAVIYAAEVPEVVDTQDEDTGLDGLPDAAPATSAPCNSRCYTQRELCVAAGDTSDLHYQHQEGRALA